LVQYRFKIREGSPEGVRVTMGERICERDELQVSSEKSREWQIVRAKVVTVMRWYAQDEMNQEEGEQNEVDGMKKGADIPLVRWSISERAVGDL